MGTIFINKNKGQDQGSDLENDQRQKNEHKNVKKLETEESNKVMESAKYL